MQVERFSELVEHIYDCALEPARWPSTLQEICEELGFISSVVVLVDFRTNEQWHPTSWNSDPHYEQMIADRFAATSAAMFRKAIAESTTGIDEPMTLYRGPFDMAEFQRSPIYLEWAKPQGYGDAANCVVLYEPHRLGTVAFMRRDGDGPTTDEQLASMRRLTPHLRRAFTIGDFINLSLSKIEMLKASLDSLALGVVLVDEAARVVHANRAGARMLQRGSPVTTTHGRLTTAASRHASELQAAIRKAAQNETELGAAGLGMPLNAAGEPGATAHVLPLSNGSRRRMLAPRAAAAVFIVEAEGQVPPDMPAVQRAYALTPAETNVRVLLVNGETLAQAAATLGVAETTVRTHLYRIFAKTGVKRQSDLIRLVMTLIPPIERPD